MARDIISDVAGVPVPKDLPGQIYTGDRIETLDPVTGIEFDHVAFTGSVPIETMSKYLSLRPTITK